MLTLLVAFVIGGLLTKCNEALRNVKRKLKLVKYVATAKYVRVYLFVTPNCEYGVSPLYTISEQQLVKRKKVTITETNVQPWQYKTY